MIQRRRYNELLERLDSVPVVALLGSASAALLRQSSETLAGRISYLELSPFSLLEVGDENVERHWLRGGYPDRYLARTDRQATLRCSDFITSYVERYLPEQGVGASATELRRLCTMLAHLQATAIDYSQVGGALGLDGKTVRRYVDLLEGLYLVRQLPPWSRNVGKRLVKSPRVYWRDTGVVHSLLSIGSYDQLLGHPICGHSWESYCIEQIIEYVPPGVIASYYRTQAGAEIDWCYTWGVRYTEGQCLSYGAEHYGLSYRGISWNVIA